MKEEEKIKKKQNSCDLIILELNLRNKEKAETLKKTQKTHTLERKEKLYIYIGIYDFKD